MFMLYVLFWIDLHTFLPLGENRYKLSLNLFLWLESKNNSIINKENAKNKYLSNKQYYKNY